VVFSHSFFADSEVFRTKQVRTLVPERSSVRGAASFLHLLLR